MSNEEMQAEIKRTQAFAEKIVIYPYSEVKKTLSEAAQAAAISTQKWLNEQTTRMAANQ